MLDSLLAPEYQSAIRSLVLLLVAVITSLTAMIVGFVVYGRQKRIDRENDTLSERRLLYGEYISAAAALMSDLLCEPDDAPSPSINVSWRKYAASLNKLQVIAPDRVLAMLEEHEFSLEEFSDALFPNDKKKLALAADLESTKRAAVLNEMRADNFSGTSLKRISIHTIKLNEVVDQ